MGSMTIVFRMRVILRKEIMGILLGKVNLIKSSCWKREKYVSLINILHNEKIRDNRKYWLQIFH